jgi:hypothetical protein
MGQPAISPSQAVSDEVRQSLPGNLPVLVGIKR